MRAKRRHVFVAMAVLISACFLHCDLMESVKEAQKAMEKLTEEEFRKQFEKMAREMEEEMKKTPKRRRKDSSSDRGYSKDAAVKGKRTRGGVLVLESGEKVSFSEILNLSSVKGDLRDRDVRIPFKMIDNFNIVSRNGNCVWYHSDKGDFFEPCRIKVELNDGRYFTLDNASVRHIGDRKRLGECRYRQTASQGGSLQSVEMKRLKSVRFHKG